MKLTVQQPLPPVSSSKPESDDKIPEPENTIYARIRSVAHSIFSVISILFLGCIFSCCLGAACNESRI